MGQCYCVPGKRAQSASTSVVLGRGDTSTAAADVGFSAGDRAWVGAGPRTRLHRVDHAGVVGADLLLADADFGGAGASVGVDSATGTVQWQGGSGGLDLPGVDGVQLFESAGAVFGLTTYDGLAPSSETGPTRVWQLGLVSNSGASGALSLPEDTTAGGTTRPRVLGAATGDGVVPLFWRDGTGQAWLALLDLAEAAAAAEGPVPLRAGPTAVGGTNVDLFEMLQVNDARPLAVGFVAGTPDDLLLDDSAAARDLRYPGRTAVAGLPTGPVVMLTVDLAGSETGPAPEPEAVCTLANLIVPVLAIGAEDWADQVWVERPTDPDCVDLAQPLAAGTFFADGREGVFRIDGLGQGTVTAALDETEASTLSVDNPTFIGPSGPNNNILASLSGGAGDVDGDGIDEVFVTAWGPLGLSVGGWSDGGFSVWGVP